MMTLIERLRAIGDPCTASMVEVEEVCKLAADRIEELEASLKKYQDAFTTRDGVVLEIGDKMFYGGGPNIEEVNDNAIYVEDDEADELIAGAGSPYSYEDYCPVSICWADPKKYKEWTRQEADILNRAEAADEAIKALEDGVDNVCSQCGGCGQIASSDEGEPWTYWANLPFRSSTTVIHGMVKPIPCPKCNTKKPEGTT